jgi:hypothetical protein
MQKKATNISAPEDPLEQEADRVAAQVVDQGRVAHPLSSIGSAPAQLVQRQFWEEALVGGAVSAGPIGWALLAVAVVGAGIYLATRPSSSSDSSSSSNGPPLGPPQTGYPAPAGPPVAGPPITAPPITAPPITAPPITAPPITAPTTTTIPTTAPTTTTMTRRHPNQTCEDSRLDTLQAIKDAICGLIVGESCSPSKVSPKRLARRPCSEIVARIAALRACLAARQQIQSECFGNIPDPTHARAIQEILNGITACEALQLVNCAPGHPMERL